MMHYSFVHGFHGAVVEGHKYSKDYYDMVDGDKMCSSMLSLKGIASPEAKCLLLRVEAGGD